jgi:uncharacterized protein (TIGR01777 family)
MKVAVTGGTGFIGRALVRRLAGAGHEILVLSRHPAPEPAGRVRSAFFDAVQEPQEQLLQQMEAVVHLAGASIAERWTPAHKERILQSRQRGTHAVSRAAVQSKTVRTLVCASAVGFYGPHGAEELSEDSPAGKDFLAHVCSVWEDAAWPARDAGIRVVHLRIGIPLHPEGGALKKMLVPFKLGLGGRIGSGDQYLSWIHREDLLSLLMHALSTASLQGAVNATAPAPVTNREFARALGHALKRPAIAPAPAFVLKVALGEMSSVVLTGQRVLPVRALASGFQFAFPHLRDALEDLVGDGKPSVSAGSVATGAPGRQ